jgi:putative transposase
MNRGSRKGNLFGSRDDYIAFERLLSEARERHPVRILAYCLMPNHWHLLLWPEKAHDEALSRFMHWLTGTHAGAWRRKTDTAGQGAVYQSRFKAVAILDECHLLGAWRYVERNPVESRLVIRAEEWPWSSASYVPGDSRDLILDPGPCRRPRDWLRLVNSAPDGPLVGVADPEPRS